MVSCKKEPPQIMQEHTQLNLFKDTEKNLVYQKLTLFVLITDPNGLDDIDKIYFINDELNLFWEADSHSLNKALLNNQTWLGINSISMNDYSLLPKGEYRFLVVNLGGEIAETIVPINYIDFKPESIIFPSPVITQESIDITGKQDDYLIWVYDMKGNFLETESFTGGKIYVNQILAKNQKLGSEFIFYIYSKDTTINMGIISGPFYYKR